MGMRGGSVLAVGRGAHGAQECTGTNMAASPDTLHHSGALSSPCTSKNLKPRSQVVG